jgi:hypothetical protein
VGNLVHGTGGPRGGAPPPGAAPPPGGGWDYRGGGGLRARSGNGALVLGPTARVLRLFVIEVALDQTLGNWYHFIKPIRRVKNLIIVK